MAFTFLQLPKYENRSPLLDLSPINQAFGTIMQQRQLGVQNARADEQQRLERERFALQERDSNRSDAAARARQSQYDSLVANPEPWMSRSPEVMAALRVAGPDQAADIVLKGRNADLERANLIRSGRFTDAQIAQLSNKDQNLVHFKPGETAGIFDKKTGTFRPIDTGNSGQAQFNAKFADEAPKLYAKANESFFSSQDALQTAQDMKALAPHIYSGTWAGLQTETFKFFNTKFGANFTGVAPTELFNSLAQKFVGQEGQKYKPLSNSDIGFIEKGLPNIQKDPTSIPHIIGAMETVAKREALARRLEMSALQKGVPADPAEIIARVDAAIPSYVSQYAASLSKGQPQPQPQQAAPAADPLSSARDAIKRGVPRDEVIRRLIENNINPQGL